MPQLQAIIKEREKRNKSNNTSRNGKNIVPIKDPTTSNFGCARPPSPPIPLQCVKRFPILISSVDCDRGCWRGSGHLCLQDHRRLWYVVLDSNMLGRISPIALPVSPRLASPHHAPLPPSTADMGMHSQDQAKIRLSGAKRRSLIDRALVASQCHRSKRRQHSPTDVSTCAAGDDNIEMHASDDATSCPICLRDFRIEKSDICRPVSCSHAYHRSCITGWLELHETCPLCRSDILHDVAPMAPSRRRLLWTQSTMWGEDM